MLKNRILKLEKAVKPIEPPRETLEKARIFVHYWVRAGLEPPEYNTEENIMRLARELSSPPKLQKWMLAAEARRKAENAKKRNEIQAV